MVDPLCTCLSELSEDAYSPGGPMSGKPKPPPCRKHSAPPVPGHRSPRDRMIALAREWRHTMDLDILRSWAPDIVSAVNDETKFENPKPIAVMMQEVRDHSGRAGLIVIQRPDNLGWAFPAGYVEVGLDQSAEGAAAREFKEETGITPSEGFLFKSEITPVGGKLMLFVQSRGYLLDTELDDWKPTAEALAIRVVYEPEPLVFGTHQDAMASYFSLRSYLE